MRISIFTLSFTLAAGHFGLGQEPPDTNYDESKVPKCELPDPLVCFDGRPVADAKMWQEVRRPEILSAFATHIYGRVPPLTTRVRFEVTRCEPRALEGIATRKEVRIRLFEPADAPWIADRHLPAVG